VSNLKRLGPYIAPHKKQIAIAFAATALSGALDGGFLLLAERVLKPMLDANDSVPVEQRMGQLNFYVVAILFFSAFRVFVDFAQQYLTQRTGQRILFNLRQDLFAHFQTLSIAFFERKRTGEVMSRLTNDVQQLQQILTSAVVSIAAAPIALILALGYMFSKNWQLSLFVILILPPVGFLVSKAGKRIREAISQLQQRNANVTNYLQEKVSAMRLIQTFGTTDIENKLFQDTNERAYRATMKPIRIQSSLGPIIEFTGMCGVVAALWFGSRQVMAGTMDASALFAFIFAVHRAAMRFKSIANLNLIIKSAEAAAGRLWEIFDTKPEVTNSPNAVPISKNEVKGHLKFEKVRFAYAEGPDVLHDIELEIKPGEVVALAGLSGSGKTTIASLIPRLYDPTNGRITLDGRDIRDIDLQSLRDLIGAVPQDVTLFHGTLRDNISYGSPNATHGEIVAAARRAHADEFIRTLPEGYDSPVGERGGGFSGGQKQRLAIARALLRDPKLLILDEATSALDAESEGLVQDALAELMKGRTTLIIAHRFSTIVNADKILVMDGGHIIEAGTHRELIALDGQYSRLFQMQSMQARRGEVDAEEEVNPESPSVPVA
jgi:subfamily B ATP-binding cassette protein MsbA